MPLCLRLILRFRLLALSMVLLALMVLLYRFSLKGLGSMLQRREKDILQKVTHEVE